MCLPLAGLPLWSTHWQLPVNKADPGTRVYSIETTGNRPVYRWGRIGMKAEKSTPIFIFRWVNTGKDIATYFLTPTNWFLGHLQGEEHGSTNSCLHTFLLRRTRLGGYSTGIALLWQINNKTNVLTAHYTCTCSGGSLLFFYSRRLANRVPHGPSRKGDPVSDNSTLGQMSMWSLGSNTLRGLKTGAVGLIPPFQVTVTQWLLATAGWLYLMTGEDRQQLSWYPSDYMDSIFLSITCFFQNGTVSVSNWMNPSIGT